MFINRTHRRLSAKFAAFFTILFLLLAAGCKSAGKQVETTPKAPAEQQNTLKKYPGAMLWQIDGTAADGTPSKVYLLGTYHAGDDRVLTFPECVSQALEESAP